MKIDGKIWEEFNSQEKKLAKGKLVRISFISFFAILCWFFLFAYFMNNIEEERVLIEDISQIKLIFIVVSIVAFLYFFGSLLFISTTLRKEIIGDLSIISVLILLPVALLTNGIIIIIGLVFMNFFRKRIVKKIKPELLKKCSNHEEDTYRKKALFLLDKGIKLAAEGNYIDARKMYEEAYNLGDGRGAYYIARMLENGEGGLSDFNEIFMWEKRAADKGVASSQYYLGLELINGKNVLKDESLGMSYLEKAAIQEDYDSLMYLGLKCGIEMSDKYFNIFKASDYLKRAIKASTNNIEKGNALNELGRLVLIKSREPINESSYVIAINLFYRSKQLGNEDARSNYDLLVSKKPEAFSSIEEILNSGFVDQYLNYKIMPKEKNDSEYSKLFIENNENKMLNSDKKLSKNDNNVIDLKGLRTTLLTSIIIKLLFFGAGLSIILYTYNNTENLKFLTFFTYLGGIIIGGFPSLFKSFNDAYKSSEKWDSFFKQPNYKVSYNYSKRVAKISKNDDWYFIIYKTILNLIVNGLATPFEVIRDLYRILMINNKIKEYL